LDLSLALCSFTNTLATDGSVNGIVMGDGGGDAIITATCFLSLFGVIWNKGGLGAIAGVADIFVSERSLDQVSFWGPCIPIIH